MEAISNLFNPLSRTWAVDLGLFLLRAGTGLLMLPHGLQKLNSFSEKGEGFYDFMHLGGRMSLALTIFAELICSALLVVGLGTRFILIPLIITMVIVVFVINAQEPLGDKESGLLYLVPFIALLFTGPGRISLDQMVFSRRHVSQI
ncbi:MAG: DoxX family protein [Saprospiraceae bacterium]